MVNKLILLSLALVILPTSVYAQVADTTVAGIIVPKVTSTQSSYCSNGKCQTSPVIVPANYTYSVSKYPVLLVILSQTCEILDKHNMKGCPSMKELMPFDTSNQMVSGKFVNQSGVIIRTNPQVKNNWLAYQYSTHTIVCIECLFDIPATNKAQQIIIQPNSFSFVNKTETESTGTFYNYIGRSMQGCQTATISNLPGLLNDTIHFMLSGCTTTATNFNNTEKHVIPKHIFSYDNPYSSLHQDLYLKSMMQGHTYDFGNKTFGGRGPADCIRHQCNFIDPYKKIGW